ncbi:MAG: hypothetical protein U0168_11645 [Nannocystaceae bacterium]
MSLDYDALERALAPLGAPAPPDPSSWPAYVEQLGVTEADVPMLLELVKSWADPEHFERFAGNDDAVFAPVHAWRTLAQLRTPAVIDGMLELLVELESQDDELAAADLPAVAECVGAAAIAPLRAFVDAAGSPDLARAAAIAALEGPATDDPELRAALLPQWLQALGRCDPAARFGNAAIVAALVAWRVPEAIETVQRAFAADAVDDSVGSFNDVAVALGVRERWASRGHGGRATDKRARKREKQARKANRKRR